MVKIIRNETGRWADLADLKSFDINGIDSETYGDLVMALQQAIELYELREWHKESDSPYSADFIKRYERYKRLLAQLTDYRNHPRTFNGKEAKPYSQK